MKTLTNLLLVLAIFCTVAFIACNDQTSDLQEMEKIVTTDNIVTESGMIIAVPIGHPYDDPQCRARTYNDGTRYCETLTPCPTGKCKVVLRTSGHSCNCK